MGYKFKYLEKVIGAFVLISIIILIATVIFIARGKQLFVKKHHYFSYIEKGAGVKKGTSVVLNGIEIGTITDIALTDDNSIKVNYYVLDKYANRMREDTLMKMNIPFLGLGSKTLEILPGTTNSPSLNQNAYVFSVNSPEGKKILAKKNQGKKEEAERIVSGIGDLVDQLKDPRGPLMMTLNNLERISTGINEKEVDSIIGSLEKTFKNLADVSENLKTMPLFGGSKEKAILGNIDISERSR